MTSFSSKFPQMIKSSNDDDSDYDFCMTQNFLITPCDEMRVDLTQGGKMSSNFKSGVHKIRIRSAGRIGGKENLRTSQEETPV